MAITGVGFGVYTAVDLALVADVLPDKAHRRPAPVSHGSSLLEDDTIAPRDLSPASSYSPSPTRSAMATDPGRSVTPAPGS
jgi:hypothetical protein